MRYRARTLIFFLALLMAALPSAHLRHAHATPGPLSGLYDLHVHIMSETVGIDHCIARLDEDGTTHEVAAVAQCYADANVSDPNAEPPPRAGEGPDFLPGLPPPPPYLAAPPAVGTGQYDPATEDLYMDICFPNLGGTLGPYAIGKTDFHLVAQQLAYFGKFEGELIVYPRQGKLQCDALSPLGTPNKPEEIAVHPVDDVNGSGQNWPAAWRTLGDHDFDDDGCTDEDELLPGAQHPATCGDDPYSPYDSSAAAVPDISGNDLLFLTFSPADVCWSSMSAQGACALPDGTIIGGSYVTCVADVQQAGSNVSARMLCYLDDPLVVVNPQLAGDSDHNGVPDTACPPAPSTQCGDGLLGPAPPGVTASGGAKVFADIDDRHFALAGQIDGAGQSVTLAGCWEDRDGFAALGNVYLSLTFDARTGRGTASRWDHQTSGACMAATPTSSAVSGIVDVARQATAAAQRDTDSDGCPDARELADNQLLGGLRDPLNRYDFPDMPVGTPPVRDKKIRVDDVTFVVNRYRHNQGDTVPPLYDPLADHKVVLGSNLWNLGPGDGKILIDDVVAVVNSYRHDCS